MRVSLTADPVEEIAVAFDITLRRRCAPLQAEIVSMSHVQPLSGRPHPHRRWVTRRLATINKPLKVAVMGCVVKRSGEARFADVGVACGREEGLLFARGGCAACPPIPSSTSCSR